MAKQNKKSGNGNASINMEAILQKMNELTEEIKELKKQNKQLKQNKQNSKIEYVEHIRLPVAYKSKKYMESIQLQYLKVNGTPTHILITPLWEDSDGTLHPTTKKAIKLTKKQLHRLISNLQEMHDFLQDSD